MEEVWKRIQEASSYEVSTEGRVRNRGTGRILKPVNNPSGSVQVSLREGNKSLTRSTNALRKRAFEQQ